MQADRLTEANTHGAGSAGVGLFAMGEAAYDGEAAQPEPDAVEPDQRGHPLGHQRLGQRDPEHPARVTGSATPVKDPVKTTRSFLLQRDERPDAGRRRA